MGWNAGLCHANGLLRGLRRSVVVAGIWPLEWSDPGENGRFGKSGCGLTCLFVISQTKLNELPPGQRLKPPNQVLVEEDPEVLQCWPGGWQCTSCCGEDPKEAVYCSTSGCPPTGSVLLREERLIKMGAGNLSPVPVRLSPTCSS